MKSQASVLVRRIAIFGLALAVVGGTALGYVRIVIGGETLYWNSNTIGWQLSTPGWDDLSEDGSHRAAVRHGLESWENVYGSNLNFRFDGETSSTNFSSHSSHLVVADENNSTGFFPSGTGMVAVTPISYRLSDGRILDADIILNARDWFFSTDLSQGTFDIQDIVTHEAGHLIGLDHSPSLSSSMWPYVSASQWLHRSLSADDKAGAVALKPYGGDSRLNGRVLSPQGGGLSSAVIGIVNVHDGRQMTTVLSEPNGNWTVRGLEAGDYWVYVTPLEGGMGESNLTGDNPVDTNFSADFYGGYQSPYLFALAEGEIYSCGDWILPADSPLQDYLGASKQVHAGSDSTFTLSGSGFSPGGLQIRSKSPYITITKVGGGSSWRRVCATVSSGAPVGQYDLFFVHSTGFLDIAPGAIEVVEEAPSIQSLSHSVVSIQGGEKIQIHGNGFQEGCWVVIGGKEAVQSTWIDSQTLEVIVPGHDGGEVNVMLQNPDAQSCILRNALTYVAVPIFTELWPVAGQSNGGTKVLVHGEDFSSGIQVLLNGRQASTTWISSRLIEVLTPFGTPGGADFIFRNPSAADVVVEDAFLFVSSQDPQISDFTPSTGNGSGGALVKLFGRNLENPARVLFGVDSSTGLGGVEGEALHANAPNEIQVRSPHYRAGSWGVKLELANGQGVMAPGTFFFQPAPVVGGCAGVVGRPGAFQGWGELPSFLVLFLGAWILRRKKGVLVE
ncbi:MAG: hypothetical protein CMJ96_00310 [Planctomycetes bacterium]|nr:hypothetical protein [Planctomycetota bacterium]|tara:strand:+ start:34778 stop:36961 length:2184 start_codon:yes stop_codon:yes gene_type:complete